MFSTMASKDSFFITQVQFITFCDNLNWGVTSSTTAHKKHLRVVQSVNVVIV